MMTKLSSESPVSRASNVFHWAVGYDILLRLFWGKQERLYRQKVLRLAEVRRGEAVLDIGCGTGTLALAAKAVVGSTGKVAGIDASPEMIARAQRKSAKAALQIDLKLASVDRLPFLDASFDAVLTTTVLHCLPREALDQCFLEMRRVLKPSGRLLAVDFAHSRTSRGGFFSHMRQHRNFDVQSVIPDIERAGFSQIRTASMEFGGLHYILAV